jgi:cytochrome bd-type quinol oxidase subunit 1
MLGVPLFALVVEFIGTRRHAKRYDDLAREFTKLVMISTSTTAAFGAIFTFLLFTLYPYFMSRLTDVFLPTMIIYPLLFFGEIFTLYLYWLLPFEPSCFGWFHFFVP